MNLVPGASILAEVVEYPPVGSNAADSGASPTGTNGSGAGDSVSDMWLSRGRCGHGNSGRRWPGIGGEWRGTTMPRTARSLTLFPCAANGCLPAYSAL